MTLFTAAQFARHLEQVAKRLGPVAHANSILHGAMIRSCVLVQRTAQDRLGEYHQATGPYAAWQQLAEPTQAERARLGFAPNKPLLRTGDLGYSIEFTIIGNVGNVGSDSPIAVYQELGTRSIPARSFVGAAAFICEPQVRKIFVNAIVRAFTVAPPGSMDLSGLGRPAEILRP